MKNRGFAPNSIHAHGTIWFILKKSLVKFGNFITDSSKELNYLQNEPLTKFIQEHL